MSDTATRSLWSSWMNALRHRGQGNGDSISGPLPVRDYVNVTAQPSTVMGFDQALIAIGGVGDDDDRTARSTLGIELFQYLEFHG